MSTIYFLFHAKSVEPFRPCMDGLFAAYAAALAFPEERELIPAIYGEPPSLNLRPDDKVYLLDLTYPAHILESWADQGADVIVIDHHKSAMNDLSGLSDRVFQKFDMGKSGAVLAWEFFFPRGSVLLLFRYVQDRDIWTKQLPNTELVSLGLAESMRDKDLEECLDECWLWHDGVSEQAAIEGLIDLGESVNIEIQKAIQGAVARATKRIVAGFLVPFVRVESDRERQAYSDIAHLLLKWHPTAPFSCVETGGGWALRSEDGREDVSRIAKSLGGGGHRNAAGCRSGNPLAW